MVPMQCVDKARGVRSQHWSAKITRLFQIVNMRVSYHFIQCSHAVSFPLHGNMLILLSIAYHRIRTLESFLVVYSSQKPHSRLFAAYFIQSPGFYTGSRHFFAELTLTGK